jgi:hypothetical protein
MALTPISLYKLEAELSKIITVTTTEIETDGNCKGQYVFRSGREKFMWGPKPYRYEYHDVLTVAAADQVMFMCPLCFTTNGGPKGTHRVLVSFADRNIPDGAGSRDSNGKPSRWKASGTTIFDLVLTPSILLDASQKKEVGCHWHGFVGSNGIPAGCAG